MAILLGGIFMPSEEGSKRKKEKWRMKRRTSIIIRIREVEGAGNGDLI